MEDGLPTSWRNDARAWAAGKERIHELHLFGSRAKGDHVAESDADLACVLTGSNPSEVDDYAINECGDWERQLRDIIGVAVQLEIADPFHDTVVWPAVREHGQLLYRKPGYLPVE